ncbi:hypothetical protein F4604DRAFT_1756610 [Suillus subluteus]|nr:hypothetical protein F4604DRAFT_1756610 [Suillus subluteus]
MTYNTLVTCWRYSHSGIGMEHAISSSSLLQRTLWYHILLTTVQQHIPLTNHMNQSNQPVVLYKCQLQGIPCGLHVEGTTCAVTAHLRRHGITGLDSTSTICTWGGCSKTLKKGSMTRHLLTHLGVKACCSACGVVKCRDDLLRAHIKSSEPCHSAVANTVHGPEGYVLVPPGLAEV